jgi:hypothetical protein
VQDVFEKTADAAGFEVAVLHPDEKSGRPHIERRINGGHTAEVELMDVIIPFTGSPESFTIAPSHNTRIDIPVAVHRDALVATFPRDDCLEGRVTTFIRCTSQNLDQMREDMGALRARVRNAIAEAAHRRAERLKSQQEPYRIRTFPIRGD